MLKSVLLTLSLVSLSAISNSQPLSNEKELVIRECLNKIYEMDFNRADSILSVFEKKSFKEPSYYLLKSYYLRWKHLPISEGDKVYDDYTAYLDSTVTYSTKKIEADENKLEASYYKMSSHIMIAELRASNGDFVKGAFEGRKALPIIKKGFELYDQNAEFFISTALYNYYIEYYRNKGFFYRSLLFPFPKGDSQKGLDLLKKGYQKGLFTSVESLLYLAHINFKFEKKPLVGLKYCAELYNRFSTNFKFQEMYLENLLHVKKYEQATPVLSQLKKSDRSYYQSKALLFEGIMAFEYYKTIDKGRKLLNKALSHFENLPGDNDHFRSLTYLKLAQLEEVAGNSDKSVQWLKKAKKLAKYPYIIEEVGKLEI